MMIFQKVDIWKIVVEMNDQWLRKNEEKLLSTIVEIRYFQHEIMILIWYYV